MAQCAFLITFFLFFLNMIHIWEFWQNMESLTVNNNFNVILLFTAHYYMIKKTGNT